MGRPKGSRNNRPEVVALGIDASFHKELVGVPAKAALDRMAKDAADMGLDYEPPEPALDIPPDWQMGALLNVRNTGADYCVTLYPEEYDWRHPERAVRFTNPARCQDFVSQWYARVWVDPRAR